MAVEYSVVMFKARWLRPAFGESCRLLRVNQAKGLVVDRVRYAPHHSFICTSYFINQALRLYCR